MSTEPDKDRDPLAPHSMSAKELKELLAAQRAEEAFLAFRDEHGLLTLFALGPEGLTRTLGRRAQTDLPITWDPQVSGLHAELHSLGGEWAIVDDGLSRNGTYLNGQRVNGRQRLRGGDRIRVGRTTLVYDDGHAAPVEETVTAGRDPARAPLTDMQRRVLIALCRPYRDGDFATPATNQEIASELFLSVEAVKMHLRTLFGKFELGELPQNQKRARLAECVLQYGVLSRRELD
jgi:FHA domain